MIEQLMKPSRSHEDILERVDMLWLEALGDDGMTENSDFFQLGGDSLSAVQFVARVEEEFGVELPIEEFVQEPTREATVRIASRQLEKGGHRAALEAKGSNSSPLTLAQRSVMNYAGFSLQWLYMVDGALDVQALRATIDELVRRHSILRTRVRRRLASRRQVSQPWKAGYLRVVRLAELRGDAQRTEAERLLNQECYGPIHVNRDFPFRAMLIEMNSRKHLLGIGVHEFAADATSEDLLAREVSTLYGMYRGNGQPDSLGDPDVQFSDYADWNASRVTRQVLRQQVQYWKETLADLPATVAPAIFGDELPPGEATTQTSSPSRLWTKRLESCARELGTTPFTLLLAGFRLLLLRWGVKDTAIRVAVVTRRHPKVEEIIGPFWNNVLLRIPVEASGGFMDTVLKTRETFNGALANNDVPLSTVLQIIPGRGDLGHGSGFPPESIHFQFRKKASEITLAGTRSTRHQIAVPREALSLRCTDVGSGKMELTLSSNRQCNRSEMSKALRDYETLVEQGCLRIETESAKH